MRSLSGIRAVALVLVASAVVATAAEDGAGVLLAIEKCRLARASAPQDAGLALELGQLLAKAGAVPAALEALSEARRLDPKAPGAYLLAALLLRDTNRQDEAQALLEEGLGLDVEAPELTEELCFLLLARDEKPRAAELAAAALWRYPGRPHLLLAHGLALAGDPKRKEEAADLLARALAAGGPEPGRIRLELGGVLLELGRVEPALEHLREAARLLPGSPEAHYKLGGALRAKGDREGAAAELKVFDELSRSRDAAEWKAKELGTRLNEVQALAQANRLPEALAKLDTLLEGRPAAILAPALTLRAKILYSMRRPEEALASIAEARALRPELAENHQLEGLFLLGLGRSAEAESCLRAALALAPKLDEAHELLGTALANQGRHAEAVQEFRRARELGSRSSTLEANLEASLKNVSHE